MTLSHKTLRAAIILCLWTLPLAAHCRDDPTPRVETGARIFIEYCSLCHGSQGMGEGTLALRIEDYPSTSLLKPLKATSAEQVKKVIIYGNVLDNISSYMPPFGNELTWSETESVALFVTALREDREQALALLRLPNLNAKSSARIGRRLFEHRCSLCHGQYGEGDGRMARIIKNPPPADLTASRLPDDYLLQIIRDGGEGVQRSPQMPPWGDQLSEAELNSILLYLKAIRD